MKIVVDILIALALMCFLVAVLSKVTAIGLYGMGVKPIAALVFGNSCLLLALVLNSVRK
ncbi:MAG: hypothetical protein ISS26_05495 [Candidatus Omnitrophica bacterium]|nr:hypothetical protein [Candidatus Omnitrophota bacterium]